MSITGGIKFFERDWAGDSNGGSIVAGDSNPSAQYAIDRNRFTYYRSSGSTDLITEELTITFDEARSISRLFLIDHNWKSYNIQYMNGSGSFTNFTSVVGLGGAQASVTETTYARDTAYYEVATVSTTSIRLQVTTTQTANQEKYLQKFIATSELGTLVGYPRITSLDADRQARVKKTLSGRVVVQKGIELFGFDLDFKNYPPTSTYSPDFDLMMSLHDRENPFLVWLCGGRSGSPYQRYVLRGFRLQDVLNMQVTKGLKLSYNDNIYTAPINTKVTLEESI